MFSSTLKRSAATLGVVAGLLAAAGPASAMDYEGSPVVTYSVKAPTTPTANGFGLSFEHIDMNARSNAGPAGKTMAEDSWTESAWHQSVVEGLAAAPGTQVGSEGVKAPVVVLIGANDYGFTEGNDQPCRCDTEARIGGKMHLEDISLGIRGDA